MFVRPPAVQEHRIFPQHVDFDAMFKVDPHPIAHYYGKQYIKGYEYQLQAKGDFDGDIRSNDCDLILSCGMKGSPGTHLFRAGIQRFTGNCGVKSINHLWMFHAIKKHVKAILKLVESFAFHYCNCGYLIGSDASDYGYTGNQIKNHGDNYVIVDPIWNPNYTWDKSHQIFLFYKNLNNRNYPNYWGIHPREANDPDA